MLGSPQIKKDVTLTSEREKAFTAVYNTCDFLNMCKWSSNTNRDKTENGKSGNVLFFLRKMLESLNFPNQERCRETK